MASQRAIAAAREFFVDYMRTVKFADDPVLIIAAHLDAFAAEEREACAKLADNWRLEMGVYPLGHEVHIMRYLENFAKDIRAGGKQ